MGIISTSSEPLIDLVDSDSNGEQIPTGSEGGDVSNRENSGNLLPKVFEGSPIYVESESFVERSLINSNGKSGSIGENGRNTKSVQCDNSHVITDREADSIPGGSNREIAEPNNLEDANEIGNSRPAFMESKVQFATPSGGVRGESGRSNRNSNDRESSQNGSNRKFCQHSMRLRKVLRTARIKGNDSSSNANSRNRRKLLFREKVREACSMLQNGGHHGGLSNKDPKL